MKVTDFVSKDNTCLFLYYRQKNLYYLIYHVKTNEMYKFPIPIDDLGGATVSQEEQSIYLMRYIRKAIKDKTMVIDENN